MAKITNSIPDDLLEMVKRECVDIGQSRSQFLCCAAEEYIRLIHERRKHEQWAKEEAEVYSRCPDEPIDSTSWDSVMLPVFGGDSWEEYYQEFIKKNETR